MILLSQGDRVRIVEPENIKACEAYKGFETVITKIFSLGVYVTDSDGDELFIKNEELKYLEKIEPKKTKNQRISALEDKVAKLEKVVAELTNRRPFKPNPALLEEVKKKLGVDSVQSVQNQTIEFEGGTYRKVERRAQAGDVVVFNNLTSAYTDNGKPYKVQDSDNNLTYTANSGGTYKVYGWGSSYPLPEVYELVEHPQSKNQKRAAIIERAKQELGPLLEFWNGCINEFVVNPEKRTVVALRKEFETGRVVKRSIAKCHPEDVFNSDIGKLIAFGRAVNKDVSEFEQAVQPDEVVVGMGIRNTAVKGGSLPCVRVDGNRVWRSNRLWISGDYAQITDDSNAQYGEAKVHESNKAF